MNNRQYWSPTLKRWVHLDSCECARDQHLLYDKGWGKKQSYILAFSIEGAQDVTKAYVQDWEAALQRRTWISENELARLLDGVTSRRRAHLDPRTTAQLQKDDETQRLFLDGKLGSREEESLQPRQSGAAEWKASRGEDGMKGLTVLLQILTLSLAT
jgi:peptide-N4-(N-acetyl-beta-glucosaminyl)asparagine amidase